MKQDNKDILELVNQYRFKFGENLHDTLLESIYSNAAEITNKTVSFADKDRVYDFDSKLDKIVTSKLWGFPIMVLLLAIVFWLTIQGANYPSQFLAYLFIEELYPLIRSIFVFAGFPNWITGLIVDGGYLASAWIISVMLPPMAIFFPLFTLLEDYGYLPRVSFNLDNLFRKVGAHGKQALTMTMGFGCNAAGVVATRIIDSPRERLIAIITNNFSICNGRWPLQILVATLFIGGMVPSYFAGVISASAVVLVALLGIGFSLLVSLFLSKTVLKGEPSAFSLELPPYRPPRLLQTLYTSFIDRTLVVLWRAVIFAFPSGLVIWLISNVTVNDISISQYLVNWLDPFGLLIGLNGIIILAYIIAIPANEVVIPTILMLTVLTLNITGVGSGAGVLFESDNVEVTFQILKDGGWTLLTGINIMIFSLLHNPCSTTIYTIYKETRSAKWTIIATFLPILMGVVVCLLIALLFRIV